jgi:hypothetical protein
MSVRTRYIATWTVGVALIPLTWALSYTTPGLRRASPFVCLGALVVSQIYAELVIRCTGCAWRVGSYQVRQIDAAAPMPELQKQTRLVERR